MIMNKPIRKHSKVGVSIYGIGKVKFANGNKSMSFTIYDATPEEIVKVFKKAMGEN